MRVSAFLALALTASTAMPASANGSVPKALTCSFETGSTVTYAKGKYKSKTVMLLSFRMTGIDLARQKASLESGSGKSNLRVVRAVNANHFLEVVTEGFLNITTVYDLDTATASYPAVHSRHFGLFGEPVVAQYYGFCKAAS